MAPTSPFKTLVRELIVRLPSSTSSQLDLVRELEVAVIGRRTELESCAVPVIVAERPAVGETHSRDEPPPPLLPPPQLVHPPCVTELRPPPHGTVTHIAGEAYDFGDEGRFRDGSALTARFRTIGGIVATDGVLYMSDSYNHRIRKLHAGVVSTLAGTGVRGFQDGDSDVAEFDCCSSVALDRQGRLLVADSDNHRIRAVAMDGSTTTLAGIDIMQHADDGPIATASFMYPHSVLVAPDGSIYVAEFNSVRKISSDGIVTRIAGSCEEEGFADGRAGEARFNAPMGMALTAGGSLVVCDMHNHRLRRVDPTDGYVTTIDHAFRCPRSVAHSSDGTLYVAAHDGLHEIRSADGAVSRLVPSCGLGDSRPMSCHLDESNRLLYVSTMQGIFTVTVPTAAERRADRLFPLVSLWALTQRDRADIVPATGGVGVNEENMRQREVFSRIMRLRVVGVLGLVLRFAFD